MATKELGTASIGKLLWKQSAPASIGIMVFSIYMLADTIFVGQWVGAIGIAAITVVLPINFLISAMGMSIGVGGGSIIARAMGRGDHETAELTFGNQITMTGIMALCAMLPGILFMDPILSLFGGKGQILEPAGDYFSILLLGVPFLAIAMMMNNVIRALGHAKAAMVTMLLPALLNIVLDPIFIKVFGWGIQGAAAATSLSYFASGVYAAWFLFIKQPDLKVCMRHLRLKRRIVNEISSLGLVTLGRQGTISLLSLVLNNALFRLGGEDHVAVWGIINRVMMFLLTPMFGITQGSVPIIGFNFGAQQYDRVVLCIRKAVVAAMIISAVTYVLVFILQVPITRLFTKDPIVLDITPTAMVITFCAAPFIAPQLLGTAYYQSIGKPWPALLLTISRQGYILIPLLLILPLFWGIDGIWWSFPISDVLAAILTWLFLRNSLRKPPFKEA